MGEHATLRVLKGARHRLAVGLPWLTGCCCDEREASDEPTFGKPYPEPEAASWCVLCAVEGEQVNSGVKPTVFGLALGELTFDISGRRFSLDEWVERDVALFAVLEDASPEETVAAFDRTIARLEVVP